MRSPQYQRPEGPPKQHGPETTASCDGVHNRTELDTQGLWTKQISLGPRCIGWPASEISALNAARIAGKTDEEIRALVVKLEAARKSVF